MFGMGPGCCMLSTSLTGRKEEVGRKNCNVYHRMDAVFASDVCSLYNRDCSRMEVNGLRIGSSIYHGLVPARTSKDGI